MYYDPCENRSQVLGTLPASSKVEKGRPEIMFLIWVE